MMRSEFDLLAANIGRSFDRLHASMDRFDADISRQLDVLQWQVDVLSAGIVAILLSMLFLP